MPGYTDVASKAGDTVLGVMTTAQGAVVGAVASVSGLVGSVLPDLSKKLPVAGFIPTPRTVVDRTFGFAERVLDAQREYATGLAQAVEPVSGKFINTPARTKA